MVLDKPTYEEYKTASDWARFRYKYGIIVIALCWICFLFLIYYTYTNVEELAANPLTYAAEMYDVECYCYKEDSLTGIADFFVNSTTIKVLE